MSNIKTMEADQWANLEFDWVAFVPGQGEFRRYVGDYVLTENDIREHTIPRRNRAELGRLLPASPDP